MADPRNFIWIGAAVVVLKLAMALFMDWMQKREKKNG